MEFLYRDHAHSFVEACASEAEAFDAFARIFPETICWSTPMIPLPASRRL